MNIFYHSDKSRAGFTVIEALISISIIVIMTSVVLFNYPQFRGREYLELEAQNLALSIREAQFYGLSGLESPDLSGKYPDFGVFYDQSSPNDGIIFFADKDESGNYTTGVGGDDVIKTYKQRGQIKIKNLYANTNGYTGEQYLDDITEFTILYKRPDMEPDITVIVDDGATQSTEIVAYVSVELELVVGSETRRKKVTIWNSGQISVYKTLTLRTVGGESAVDIIILGGK